MTYPVVPGSEITIDKMEMTKPSLSSLLARLDGLMLRDRQRFSRRLHGAKKIKNADSQQALFDTLAAEIDAAAGKVQLREAARPAITYPDNLPVSQKKQDKLLIMQYK